MKPIIMIQTYDGVIHDDQQAAAKHLDKQYGDIILKLTHKICGLMFETGHSIDKVSDYIDTHLDDFEKLRIIKADMQSVIDKDEE